MQYSNIEIWLSVLELCNNLDKINRDNKIHYRVKIMDFIIEIIVNSQILLCTIQNIQVC